jgi:hypothetical protein
VNAENDDIEGLYLTQTGLDATVLTPVVLTWLRTGEVAAEQPPRFAPRHPTGLARAERSSLATAMLRALLRWADRVSRPGPGSRLPARSR